MLNYNFLNNKDINQIEFIGELETGEITSSFSNQILTKYSFKSDLGIIFNFNTRGNFCSEKNQKYGNLIINSSLNNIPEIQTSEYQTPLKNGGIYQNRRFEKQAINFNLEINAPNIEILEKEIQMMKQFFNLSGKLYKNYNGQISFLNIILKEFTVGQLKNNGTEVQIIFESLSPFWVSENISSKVFENISGDFKTSIIVNDSDIKTDYTAILQVLNISGNIEKIIISILGYEIEINENIKNNDILVFNGKELNVTKNGKEIFYLGEFIELDIGIPCEIKVKTIGGNLNLYNFYILYDKIIL